MSKLAAIVCSLLFTGTCWSATTCRIVSGGGIAFGVYDVLSPSPNDSLVNIAVTCDRAGGPQNVTLTLSLGAGVYGSSTSARRMGQIGGAGDSLAYGLYRDIARSSVWGSSSGVDTVSTALSVPNHGSASTTFTIFGRMPAQQDVSQGNYTDTVQMTLTP